MRRKITGWLEAYQQDNSAVSTMRKSLKEIYVEFCETVNSINIY